MREYFILVGIRKRFNVKLIYFTAGYEKTADDFELISLQESGSGDK